MPTSASDFAYFIDVNACSDLYNFEQARGNYIFDKGFGGNCASSGAGGVMLDGLTNAIDDELVLCIFGSHFLFNGDGQ